MPPFEGRGRYERRITACFHLFSPSGRDSRVTYENDHLVCTTHGGLSSLGSSMGSATRLDVGGAGCAPGWYPRLRLSAGSAAGTDMLLGSVTRIVATVVVWLMMMENKYK